MTLKSILSPALTCFILVVGASVFLHYAKAPTILLDRPAITVVPTSIDTTAVPTVTPTVKTTSTVNKTPSPTKIATTPKPTAAPTRVVPSCIVTINGLRYDFIQLQQTHSGGDVFNCGTDMTSIFVNRHGQNWGLIARYRI